MTSEKFKERVIFWRTSDDTWQPDTTIWGETEFEFLESMVTSARSVEGQENNLKIMERDVDHLVTDWKVVLPQHLTLDQQQLLKGMGIPGLAEYRLQKQMTQDSFSAWREVVPDKK